MAEAVDNPSADLGHVEHEALSVVLLLNQQQINAFHYLEDTVGGRGLGELARLIGDRWRPDSQSLRFEAIALRSILFDDGSCNFSN